MDIDLTQDRDVIGAFNKINCSDVRRRYKDEGTKYAFDVLDGHIIAGYLIKLACFRHIRDLQRQGQDNFPYKYSVAEVEKLLKFSAICPDVDTGKPTKLMDWQKFIFSQLIGWRDLNGGKRYTTGILSIARGQGKTFLCAILMCYSFLIESIGLTNQDYLISSINFKQTGKLFGYVGLMIKKIIQQSPFKELAAETELKILSNCIVEKKTNNKIWAISHEAGQYD